MLTLGGLVDSPEKCEQVRKSEIAQMDFVNQSAEPIEISVPPLTVREKLWLDQNLDENLEADDLAFELRDEQLTNYWKYYRDYPMYTEALM